MTHRNERSTLCNVAVGAATATLAAVLLAACGSGDSTPQSSALTSGSPRASATSSGNGPAAGDSLPSDAPAAEIADRFGCTATTPESSSSSPAPASTVTVTDSNGQSIGGGDTMTCTRDKVSYRISTFENPAGKAFALGLVTAFLGDGNAKYYYCDGGGWFIAGDVHVENKPTKAQMATLRRAARTAHKQVGCSFVKLP